MLLNVSYMSLVFYLVVGVVANLIFPTAGMPFFMAVLITFVGSCIMHNLLKAVGINPDPESKIL